jgi:hypothetical protein
MNQHDTDNTSDALAVMIDFDGTDHSGLFVIYPANEESEPDFDFRSCFSYCTQGTAEYDSRDAARRAAEAEADKIAHLIGGEWYSNE